MTDWLNTDDAEQLKQTLDTVIGELQMVSAEYQSVRVNTYEIDVELTYAVDQ